MFNNKLKKRIQSLESTLGLVYVPAENKDGWNDHIAQEGSWSLIGRIKKMFAKEDEDKCSRTPKSK